MDSLDYSLYLRGYAAALGGTPPAQVNLPVEADLAMVALGAFDATQGRKMRSKAELPQIIESLLSPMPTSTLSAEGFEQAPG